MAQITMLGCVMENLVPKQSQAGIPYVCFPLREQIGKGRWQTYQVWAWNDLALRLNRLGIHKGVTIWLTGRLELVDCTSDRGKGRTKLLKVYCSDFGFLPGQKVPKASSPTDTAALPELPIPKEIDGDRMPLPE